VPQLLAASSLQSAVEKTLKSKGYEGGGIGIAVVDIERDSLLVGINSDSLFIPASVSKLITGALALDILGSNYQFSTKVYTSGQLDYDSGTLQGNLYIKGQGDPGFTAERLWLLVQHLYHKGIRKIKGDLVLDVTFFDSVTVGPGFTNEGSSRAYAPLICPLSASFNTVAIHHRSGTKAGSPVHVDIFPRIKGIAIKTDAKTVTGKSSGIKVVTEPLKKSTQVVVQGSMKVGDKPRYTYRKVWQTWETFGNAVEALFDEIGISHEGKIVSGVSPNTKPFYEFKSQPLSHYIDFLFKYSSNFAAEMIFKTIAASKNNAPGSWKHGSKIVDTWWKKHSLPGTPIIKNGSGMGSANRISPTQTSALLSYVWKQKSYLPEYLSSLSISGVDGTLSSRFRNSKLKGIVRAKTGTLNSIRVSSLAGYVLLPGRTLAFTVYCNKIGKGQYDNWQIQEQILETVFDNL